MPIQDSLATIHLIRVFKIWPLQHTQPGTCLRKQHLSLSLILDWCQLALLLLTASMSVTPRCAAKGPTPTGAVGSQRVLMSSQGPIAEDMQDD
jgi:hypothetical protein